MKIREIIVLSLWVDGSGWIYTTTISNQLINMSIEEITSRGSDWSWFEVSEPVDGHDEKLTARYYAEDDEDLQNVLYEESIWASKIPQ